MVPERGGELDQRTGEDIGDNHVVAFSRADRRSTITTQGTLELEEDELPYVNALQIGEAGDE